MDGQWQPSEIRDFCQGGLFLSHAGAGYTMPASRQIIKVRCEIPSGNERRGLAFTARVMRTDKLGAGVAFIGPDPDQIQALDRYARDRTAYYELKPSSDEAVASSPAIDHKKLIASCEALCEQHCEAMIKVFLKEASDKLFEKAGVSRQVVEQNALFNALSALSKSGGAFRKMFMDEMKAIWKEAPKDVKALAKKEATQGSTTTLSILNDDDLNDWITFQDITNSGEVTYADQLRDLTIRLGVIYKTQMGNDDNPFSPAAFSYSYLASIKELPLEQQAVAVCNAAYKTVVIFKLGPLYEDMNRLLVEQGVLPEIKHDYVITRVESIHHHKPSTSGSRGGNAGPSTPTSPQGVSEEAASFRPGGSGHHPAGENWYGLMQDLKQLRAGSAGSAGDPAESGLAELRSRPGEADARYFSQEELHEALTEIGGQLESGGEFSRQFVDDLVHGLRRYSAHTGHKKIPDKEIQVLDVTGHLYQALSDDRMVAESVRPWINKLAVPMLKVALKDESFFLDKKHTARQLINHVAQLEFYGEDAGNSGISGVRTRIENLLSRLASEKDVSPDLLDKALQEVRMLVNVQNKAYQENVNDVISACNEEMRAEAASGKEKEIPAEEDERCTCDPKLMNWVRMIKRLKPGSWIVLGVRSKPSQRLKLAWVADDFSRYVFVNKKGQMAQSLSRVDLAIRFRYGDAVLPESAEESVIDRAQFSMLEDMHKKLLHDNSHDRLTGLPQRREFERQLATLLDEESDDDARFTVCFFGLEQLDVVNSNFGFQAGDKLLLEVTDLLKGVQNDEIVLGRVSGHKFGIIFRYDIHRALHYIKHLRDLFRLYRFDWKDKSLMLSFNSGVVEAKPDDLAEHIIQFATSAYRVAKNKGANHIQIYEETDADLIKQKQFLEWASRIDDVLNNNKLAMRCQKIVPLAADSHESNHLEMLLSLKDELGKLSTPADFVVAAEYYRRMADIDRWVIEHVFQWIIDHRELSSRYGLITINLSGCSLNDERFMGFVLAQSRRSGFPMERICFEVTETAGISNLSSASEFINDVKKTGCLFSLDDFGSGQSSYAYLKNLPVDYLKIDGAFVREMDINPADYAVVKSITEIGHFMGKKIIAEYVENSKVLEMLREIGVDYAQGFVLGKPVALNVLEWVDA